jgi:hypothetical protein
MPGFDGTGPRGLGPMTGGGRGYCAVLLPGSSAPITAGITYGPHAGRWVAPYYGIAPGVTAEDELNFLRNRVQALNEYLEGIEGRLQSLTSKK